MYSEKEKQVEKQAKLMKLEGLHLMLECFECDKELLKNSEKIKEFLSKLPHKIEMNKLEEPHIINYKGNGSWDKGGITGFVLIAESHISIHTFPHNGFLSADVYSCKPFNAEKVVAYFKEYFGSKREKVQIAKRELEF